MKRLLLALMLLAAPAFAARERLAIVKPIAMPGSLTPSEYSYSERDLRGALDLLGMDYDFLPQNVLHGNTSAAGQDLDYALGAGSVTFGGVTRAYGAAAHFWWGSGFTRAWGYNPDSLTRQIAWPVKSQLFIGPPTITGSTQWSTSSTCSTGIGPSSGAVPFGDGEGSQAQANGRAASNYLAGSQFVWKNWTTTYKLGFANSAFTGWPGITRGIVGTKTVLAGGTYETCNQCDGTTRSDPPDSVTMWYRQRSTGAGVGYGSRLIFAWPAAQGGNNGAIMQYVMALAALDSASGGTLIGAVPGWTPRKLAIFIDKAAYRSSYLTSGNDNDHGLYVGDSTATWAGLDSLDALGVPYTVEYQADRDTLAAYPYALVRLRRLVNARFAPAVYRGTFSTTTAGLGNSTARNRVDMFGALRSRLLYDAVPPYTPSATDSSVYAGIWYANALTDSLFPGRRSRAIQAPLADWVPNQFTRASMPDKNQYAKALFYAGVRTLLIDPDDPDTNPNPSFSTATAGTYVGPSTNVGGMFAAERRIPVYPDSVNLYAGGVGGTTMNQQAPVGSVKFAGIRGMRAESGALNLSLTHNYGEEFLWGFVTSNWWRTDIEYYYHYFHTPLSVFRMSIGYFGGDGTGNNRRAGWWQTKHLVNQVKSVNKLAGKTVISIVDAGEL